MASAAAALEECRKLANDCYAEWQAGDKTEDSFAALADQYSEDSGSNTKGGLYEDIAKSEWFKKAYEGKSLGGDDEQKEQKPQGVYVDCTEHPEWYGMPAKEQKPAEWSEEDEAAYTAFTCEVINEKMNPTFEQIEWLRGVCDRLKSLRPQPNTVPVENATKFGNLEYERGVKDGIQSEKSRQWKPTYEQMEALRKAVNKLADTEVADSVRLSIMYDHLKELI